jgi:pantothenate kinase
VSEPPPQHLEPVPYDDELFHRAHAMSSTGRVVLGICGAPGAGKSTLAEDLVKRFGAEAVVVPLDGFHLHDDELARLELSHRKGAPETFDVGGYLALLRRLRTDAGHTVYAPAFDRSAELAIAGAVPVRPEHKLVVTEGNYLLYDAPGWAEIHALLDEVWFVVADEETRRERLVERHARHGKPRDLAERWTMVSDQANAELVAATRERADVVVRVD